VVQSSEGKNLLSNSHGFPKCLPLEDIEHTTQKHEASDHMVENAIKTMHECEKSACSLVEVFHKKDRHGVVIYDAEVFFAVKVRDDKQSKTLP
jgi:hypothetical protein